MFLCWTLQIGSLFILFGSIKTIKNFIHSKCDLFIGLCWFLDKLFEFDSEFIVNMEKASKRSNLVDESFSLLTPAVPIYRLLAPGAGGTNRPASTASGAVATISKTAKITNFILNSFRSRVWLCRPIDFCELIIASPIYKVFYILSFFQLIWTQDKEVLPVYFFCSFENNTFGDYFPERRQTFVCFDYIHVLIWKKHCSLSQPKKSINNPKFINLIVI